MPSEEQPVSSPSNGSGPLPKAQVPSAGPRRTSPPTLSSLCSLHDEDTFATFRSVNSASAGSSSVSSLAGAIAPETPTAAAAPESRQLFHEKEEKAADMKREDVCPVLLSSELRKRVRAYGALAAAPNWVPFGKVESANLFAERLEHFPFSFSSLLRYRRNAMGLRVSTVVSCPLSVVTAVLSDHYLPLQMDASLAKSACVTAPSLPPREDGNDTRRTVSGEDDAVRLYMFEKGKGGAPAFDYVVALKQLSLVGDEGSAYGLYTPGMSAACVLLVGRDASAEVPTDPLREHQRARSLVWGVLAVAVPSDASRIRLLYTVLMDFSGSRKTELPSKTCTAMAHAMVCKMRAYVANLKTQCESTAPPAPPTPPPPEEEEARNTSPIIAILPSSGKPVSPVPPTTSNGVSAESMLRQLEESVHSFNAKKANSDAYVYRTIYKSARTTIVCCQALRPREPGSGDTATRTSKNNTEILLTVILNVSLAKWQDLVQRQGTLYKLPFLASTIARVEPLGGQQVRVTQKGKDAITWVETSGPSRAEPRCFYTAQQKLGRRGRGVEEEEEDEFNAVNGFAVSPLTDPQYIKVLRLLHVSMPKADFDGKKLLEHKDIASEIELLILLKNYTCELH